MRWLASAFLTLMLANPLFEAQAQELSQIVLPAPKTDGNVAVERALQSRRSVRDFGEEPVTLADLAQLLWAGQGITQPDLGYRTAPSAGALYPLSLYIVVARAKDLDPGIYLYQPASHSLSLIQGVNTQAALARVTSGPQLWIERAPATLVITGNFGTTAEKYGQRAKRYVPIEAGRAAQNIALQAESMGLGTTTVGAFDDDKVKRVLHADHEQMPLLLMPVGHPAVR